MLYEDWGSHSCLTEGPAAVLPGKAILVIALRESQHTPCYSPTRFQTCLACIFGHVALLPNAPLCLLLMRKARLFFQTSTLGLTPFPPYLLLAFAPGLSFQPFWAVYIVY